MNDYAAFLKRTGWKLVAEGERIMVWDKDNHRRVIYKRTGRVEYLSTTINKDRYEELSKFIRRFTSQ